MKKQLLIAALLSMTFATLLSMIFISCEKEEKAYQPPCDCVIYIIEDIDTIKNTYYLTLRNNCSVNGRLD